MTNTMTSAITTGVIEQMNYSVSSAIATGDIELMNDKTTPATTTEDIDPMIDARQASDALRIPHYWFADAKKRCKHQIPHYVLGGVVRYRLSELATWAMRNATTFGRDASAQENE